MLDWQPTASIENLKKRAELLKEIRSFFAERDVMEVTTPVLATAGVTDPFIENFETQWKFGDLSKAKTLYLQTSPEYAMKRLLAAGCKHIYQIAPAFRHEDSGRYHNPEFTMLEWYRTGFSMHDLIDEVVALLQHVLGVTSVKRWTYQSVFLHHLALDPIHADFETVRSVAINQGIDMHCGFTSIDKDDLLQLLFSRSIEPHFSNDEPCIVSLFPASQAALARLNEEDPKVANRFEVYFKGVELANGFDELTDAEKQRRRFEHDNEKRAKLDLKQKPVDENLLAALSSGLPQCSGVALGIERLLMLALNLNEIDQILSFKI